MKIKRMIFNKLIFFIEGFNKLLLFQIFEAMAYIRLILVGLFFCGIVIWLSEINGYFRTVDTTWEKRICKAEPHMWVTGNCFHVVGGLARSNRRLTCWTKTELGQCHIEFNEPMTMDLVGKTLFLLGLFLIIFNVPTPSYSNLRW